MHAVEKARVGRERTNRANPWRARKAKGGLSSFSRGFGDYAPMDGAHVREPLPVTVKYPVQE